MENDFLESELLNHIKELTDGVLNKRQQDKFNDTLDNYDRRYMASRSVKGLEYGDLPKTSPWPGCSDVGIPLEAITIQSITARVDRVEWERFPITRVDPVGPGDVQSAKKIEPFLDWQKTNLMELRIPKMKWTRKALTYGGYFMKVVFEENFVWEDIEIFALTDPKTGLVMKDDEGNPVEWDTSSQLPENEDGEPYIITPLKHTQRKQVYRGPKVYGRDPRNILWPCGETSHDPRDWDWWADCYERTIEWLENEGESIGLKNIDQIVAKASLIARENGTAIDKKRMVKIREWYGKYEINGKMRCIVAAIAPEYNVFMGWAVDKVREKSGLCRLVNRVCIPIEGEVLGQSIPRFIKGIRDTIDAVANSMIDRGSRSNNPPIIYSHGSGFDPSRHNFGYRFWPEKVPGTIRELPMSHSESTEFAKIEFLFSIVQRLFGVTDTTAGVENPNNKTYGGIATLLAEGNVNIDSIIQALNQSNIRLDELIIAMNAIYIRRDSDGNAIPIEVPIIDDYSSVMEDPDNPFLTITEDELIGKYNYIPSGSSLTSNTRQLREEAGFIFERVMQFQQVNPFLADLNVIREATANVFNSFNQKNIRIPSVEEVEQKIAQQQQAAQQKIVEAEQAKASQEAMREQAKNAEDMKKSQVEFQQKAALEAMKRGQ